MVFSSIIFVSGFLPIVLILHTLIRVRPVQNALLLLASLVFYSFGEPVYILLLLFSALMNYLFALWIAGCRGKAVKALLAGESEVSSEVGSQTTPAKGPGKAAVVLAVIANIGVLGVFKYTGFVLENVNGAFGLSVAIPNIILPIGISFFTFQALSYVIDVYRGDVAAQRNFFKLLLYISFFPQLIAGPIVRYRDIAEEIDNRQVSATNIAFGMRRFIVGLAKKVLIANTMGAAADYIFGLGAGNLNVVTAWIGAIAYLMQIYFDFSGYSDMAIGMGRMFGFHFKENFNHPYVARSMQDFWRRWHISLSSWFRDYVYIPLGGNRKGQLRTVTNRMIVFFLTGLWHGANWTFIVWGLWNGLFLLLEAFVPKLQKLPRVLAHIYTMLAVILGFVMFRADSLAEGALFIAKMFTGFEFGLLHTANALSVLTPWFCAMLVAAVLCCGVFEKLIVWVRSLEDKGLAQLSTKERRVQIACFLVAVLLLVWCIIRLAGGSYNPFIYFRF